MVRYVDDILCIIDSNMVNMVDLLNYINSYNENINFTIEDSLNDQINFWT